MKVETANPALLFKLVQLGVLAGCVFLIWYFRSREPGTRFRIREVDLPRSKTSKQDSLAKAKLEQAVPLALPGIRIDGAPHEVLGVTKRAKPEEIQRAYRDLMKRYHPDKIGPPGSQPWKDAQRIAEAINHAKDQMLKVEKK